MIMEAEKKICPYCGEEIMAAAKKCKHCGEWLDGEHHDTSSEAKPVTMGKRETAPSPKSPKGVILNAVIALLIIANLTVGFLWIRGCKGSKSVMEYDIAEVEKLMEKNTLSNRTDSISYAIGSGVAVNAMTNPAFTISSLDEIDRYKVYAGILRALETPTIESRRVLVMECMQHACDPTIQKHSTVGKLDGNIVFQGAFDVATTGRTPLLSNDEFNKVSNSSFKYN